MCMARQPFVVNISENALYLCHRSFKYSYHPCRGHGVDRFLLNSSKAGNSLVLMRTAKCNTVEVLLPKWSTWPDFQSLEYMFIFETEGCANQLR